MLDAHPMPADMTVLRARRDRAAAACRSSGVDALLLSPGPDLTYLSGHRTHPTERLTCLVLTASGGATLILPELEAPRAPANAPGIAVRTWAETDDPIALVRSLVGDGAALAIADQMWAAFVLRLERALPRAAMRPASEIMRPLRLRKDHAEIDALRAVGASADRAFARARELDFSGRSERAVAADLASLLRAEGHDDVGFTIVASGPNGASPHHEPGSRTIADGDAVVLDFGGTMSHYCSDITRTVRVGKDGDAEVQRVHDLVRRAQEAGYAAARAGAPAESVDAAARRVIADGGYGARFIHRTGHGIGLEGHEHPYLVAGNSERLEPGMAFSIEPGIYLPGRFGVRIEDIVTIGAAGAAEPLNHADRSLATVH